MGCESWPNMAIYKTCLECGEETRVVSNIEPTLTDEEATSRLLHYQFNKYYERRCAQMGIPSDGALDCAEASG